MNPEPRFARVAAMIGDPTRARMLAHLLGSEFATATELAHAAGITPQTASAHLAKLVDTELVGIRTQGRHRYFRIADGEIAHALEALSLVAEREATASPAAGKWTRGEYRPLREARSCYGHLAGRLGVALHDSLLEQRALAFDDGAFRLTDDGRITLRSLGVDMEGVSSGRRGIVYPCLDWSERRDHFAGPLAVAMLGHFVKMRWLRRVPGSRALIATPTGRRTLGALLGQALA
ncbi:MAG TPA: metalloregulator ArsR/SmtB family transcription factor [Casimicrobiaceae bacterium]|nr:metalloregulator ArsR/SmtB family transcription factor [Casimicrobiaceae bacterium]